MLRAQAVRCGVAVRHLAHCGPDQLLKLGSCLKHRDLCKAEAVTRRPGLECRSHASVGPVNVWHAKLARRLCDGSKVGAHNGAARGVNEHGKIANGR